MAKVITRRGRRRLASIACLGRLRAGRPTASPTPISRTQTTWGRNPGPICANVPASSSRAMNKPQSPESDEQGGRQQIRPVTRAGRGRAGHYWPPDQFEDLGLARQTNRHVALPVGAGLEGQGQLLLLDLCPKFASGKRRINGDSHRIAVRTGLRQGGIGNFGRGAGCETTRLHRPECLIPRLDGATRSARCGA